jgi:hypothetical protein
MKALLSRTLRIRGTVMLRSVVSSLMLCLGLAWSSAAQAQLVREHDSRSLRGFHGASSPIRRSFQSDGEARTIFKEMLNVSGLAGMEDRITIRASAETDNATATLEKDGDKEERLIFYNAEFMQELARKTKDYWSMVAVLAHELGHHVRLHTVISGRDHEFELEADYQAGFILRRMGATLQQTQAAFRTLGTDAATSTHPARRQRIQAATLGWTDGASGQPRSQPPVGTSSLPTAPKAAAKSDPAGNTAAGDSTGPIVVPTGGRQRFSVAMGHSMELTSSSIVLAVSTPDTRRNSIGVRLAGRGTRMGVGQEFALAPYGGGTCKLALLQVSAESAGFLLKC